VTAPATRSARRRRKVEIRTPLDRAARGEVEAYVHRARIVGERVDGAHERLERVYRDHDAGSNHEGASSSNGQQPTVIRILSSRPASSDGFAGRSFVGTLARTASVVITTNHNLGYRSARVPAFVLSATTYRRGESHGRKRVRGSR
jgi:hypothetical protein